ncbi:MAG TPA: CRTAC1 family protein [Pedobacter sp.]|uniref:CRTAC1 family protein n=1 Tax=Pedobacter sp. TaxID=1411316 RepID=UPI002C8F5642|nr:CRTAC1 family protein [Pedobacter sp.]HMI02891.1 CRTAC1 family protein [Pedobacter sp.]
MAFNRRILLALSCSLLIYCKPSPKEQTDAQIKAIIRAEEEQADNPDNIFNPETRIVFLDSVLKQADAYTTLRVNYARAKVFMQLGNINETIKLYEAIANDSTVKGSDFDLNNLQADLAFAYLRMGEVNNCLTNHTAESCIYPIRGGGLHKDPTGSAKAIALYEKILDRDPEDIESRWLMNIAYMTLNKYPAGVPKKYLLESPYPETDKVVPFEDIAASLKINVNNQVGSVITEDFDNDGYLDIVTSAWGLEDPMHHFKNNADGTFTDVSGKSGLGSITSGINMMQTDYNNDGYKDIFLTRGGWKAEFGNHHNSLLKNNGDGTFTEVTIESGLLSSFPTQTATWNDFNNDGWLDLFIGNESFTEKLSTRYPCELYINNHDGTFSNVSAAAKTDVIAFVKGVSSGDFDNDGWKDLFISAMDGKRILLRNKGISGKVPVFEDVTEKALLGIDKNSSFITWFWDYDNDGWLDILAGDYSFKRTLAYYAAAESLKMPMESIGQPVLYHNNGNGTFTNVTKQAGLFKSAFAMGSNFGDIDNDGFLDMFLGTGNPNFESLVPNKMFRNVNGKEFSDVTGSARVGSLQKGHGVAFADMDNDGDQDIYIEMGGAYIGDAFPSSFFLNPGQNKNNWINISLEGVASNKAAIGTRVKLTITENGKTRYIYRDVNSGGSFGASTLRREIGIGAATTVNEIEIKWHGSGKIQIFKDISPNQFIKLKEGSNAIQKIKLKTLNFKKGLPAPHHHAMNM